MGNSERNHKESKLNSKRLPKSVNVNCNSTKKVVTSQRNSINSLPMQGQIYPARYKTHLKNI